MPDRTLRCLRSVVVTAGCVLGAAGAVVVGLSPWALAAVVVVATLAGAITARRRRAPAGGADLPVAGSRCTTALRAGTPTAAATAAALLMIAGTVGLLGVVSVYVVLPVLVVAAGRAWWHRADRGDRAAAGPLPRPAGGTPWDDSGALSVPHLCFVWHRSHWLLHGLPPGPARDEVVAGRGRLLDEFERRDPEGLHRWLHSDAAASGDPAHFLAGCTDTGDGRAWS